VVASATAANTIASAATIIATFIAFLFIVGNNIFSQ
jgi:hypothetical protein